ncbi:hypothetical protein CDAR_534961 [Caerostris darwini]|uniref:C2H2-type domain-containing protein n=1 Tax=Caerostris darwini TaxID=1538125 RepID=A0AAV4QLI1_9ARAC|nr:hypothetical protein CDAR_534961 [Caerostris darwini]
MGQHYDCLPNRKTSLFREINGTSMTRTTTDKPIVNGVFDCRIYGFSMRKIAYLPDVDKSKIAMSRYRTFSKLITRNCNYQHCLIPLPFTGKSRNAHQCYVCGYSTWKNSLLKRHMLKHTGERQHKCEMCGSALKLYVCSLCNYSSQYKGNWSRHILRHTGQKPHKCQFCGKQFPRKDTLQTHMITHLKDE